MKAKTQDSLLRTVLLLLCVIMCSLVGARYCKEKKEEENRHRDNGNGVLTIERQIYREMQ